VREAVDLLADVVQRPLFTEPAVDTERTIAAAQLAQLRDDMYRYPIRLATAAAFGDDPYGRALLGTEETLARITAGAVREWHAQRMLRSPAVLAMCGDVDEDEAAAMLAAAFGEVAAATFPVPPPPAWPARRATLAETRDKAQTALALLFPGPLRRDERRHTAHLLASIASGLGGRLFEELREKRSLAYTVQAWTMERVRAGGVAAYIATSPDREDVAREALLAEFARFADAPVTDDELDRARVYALGSHAIARQSGAVVLADLIDAWLFGAGLEELDEFEEKISAVTARDIQQLAATLDPERRVEGIVRGTRADPGRG
jgi:zinc protease